jgi:hypothetical protein
MKSILVFIIQFSITSASVIQCSFTSMSWYSSGVLYSCYGGFLNSGSPEALQNVLGTHSNALSNSEVKAIYFNRQSMKKIPSNLSSYFPNLRVISCINSGLSLISSDDLKPFTHLEYLTLSSNDIVKISGDLFKFNPNIQGIIFANNKLKEVGKNLIAGLNQLRFADFQSNPCINGYAESPASFAALNSELSAKCPYQEEPSSPCQRLAQCTLATDVTVLQQRFDELSQEFEMMKSDLQELKTMKQNLEQENIKKGEKIKNLYKKLTS